MSCQVRILGWVDDEMNYLKVLIRVSMGQWLDLSSSGTRVLGFNTLVGTKLCVDINFRKICLHLFGNIMCIKFRTPTLTMVHLVLVKWHTREFSLLKGVLVIAVFCTLEAYLYLISLSSLKRVGYLPLTVLTRLGAIWICIF